jgi:hypothetical protein
MNTIYSKALCYVFSVVTPYTVDNTLILYDTEYWPNQYNNEINQQRKLRQTRSHLLNLFILKNVIGPLGEGKTNLHI